MVNFATTICFIAVFRPWYEVPRVILLHCIITSHTFFYSVQFCSSHSLEFPKKMPRYFLPVVDHLKRNGLSCLFLSLPSKSPFVFWILSCAPDIAPYAIKMLRRCGKFSCFVRQTVTSSAYVLVTSVGMKGGPDSGSPCRSRLLYRNGAISISLTLISPCAPLYVVCIYDTMCGPRPDMLSARYM